MNSFKRFVSIACLVFLFAIERSEASRADVSFCNEGNASIFTAMVIDAGIHRYTIDLSGWFEIKPGECKLVLSSELYGLGGFYFSFVRINPDGTHGTLDYYPEGKFGSGSSRSNRKFCVNIHTRLERQGSFEFLSQCPSGYKLAHFPLHLADPHCVNRKGHITQGDCVNSLAFNINESDNPRLVALTDGPPVNLIEENRKKEIIRVENEKLSDLAFQAIEMYMPLSMDSKSRRATLNDRLPAMNSVNMPAYRSCRRKFNWSTELAEKRLCICAARRIRFDMFSDNQMQLVVKDFDNFAKFKVGRIGQANRNIFDDCIAFYKNFNTQKAPPKRASGLVSLKRQSFTDVLKLTYLIANSYEEYSHEVSGFYPVDYANVFNKDALKKKIIECEYESGAFYRASYLEPLPGIPKAHPLEFLVNGPVVESCPPKDPKWTHWADD
ncbi:MAG: DUF1036 domain-containing protein [Motiliproteus sp.]